MNLATANLRMIYPSKEDFNPVLKSLLILCGLILSSIYSFGQSISGLETRWSDNFTEWILFDEDGRESGTLELVWANQKDWTAWRFRMGDSSGQIKTKWRDNFNEWELRGNNEVITIRTLWRDNFREWRIITSSKQYTFKTRYGNVFDEWTTRDRELFSMNTQWDGDPRSWDIYDKSETLDLNTQLSFVFIAMINSIPLD